jgi:hypothetical protein
MLNRIVAVGTLFVIAFVIILTSRPRRGCLSPSRDRDVDEAQKETRRSGLLLTF